MTTTILDAFKLFVIGLFISVVFVLTFQWMDKNNECNSKNGIYCFDNGKCLKNEELK